VVWKPGSVYSNKREDESSLSFHAIGLGSKRTHAQHTARRIQPSHHITNELLLDGIRLHRHAHTARKSNLGVISERSDLTHLINATTPPKQAIRHTSPNKSKHLEHMQLTSRSQSVAVDWNATVTGKNASGLLPVMLNSNTPLELESLT
jgi:hypothetical protein